jgi:hypothetical protein
MGVLHGTSRGEVQIQLESDTAKCLGFFTGARANLGLVLAKSRAFQVVPAGVLVYIK